MTDAPGTPAEPAAEPGPGDPVGIALASITIGAASGGALVSVLLFAAWGMERGAGSPFTTVVMSGGLGALACAVAVAWQVARPFHPWRRLLICAVAMAGATFIAMLTMVADRALPRYGLLALAAACVAAIVAARFLFLPRPSA